MLLERLVEKPGPLARAAVGLGGASIAVEMFAWSDRHHGDAAGRGFPHPGREIQRRSRPRSRRPEQLEVGVAALAEILASRPAAATAAPPRRLPPPMFGRIDHIGVAVEDLEAAIALYEKSFEMELAHRETVE